MPCITSGVYSFKSLTLTLTLVLDCVTFSGTKGFDSVGNVVNKPDHGTLDWVKICEKSAKVITFIDLAGHERYLKTTVFGMTGHVPDFGMLMVTMEAMENIRFSTMNPIH